MTDGDEVPYSGDELAGMVDLFGALTREELDQAVEEVAFRAGREVDPAALDDAVEAARREYRLVRMDGSEPVFAVGPTAFPTLPAGGDDLPHILDVDRRTVDREVLGEAVADRLRTEAGRAIDADDDERMATLLEVTYDAEAWAPVDLGGVRDRLDAALET